MTLEAFFAKVRAHFGKLSQEQVDGIKALLAASEGLPDRHRAYVLATAWHETASTMQPIYERGGRAYFNKYETGTKKGRELGNTVPGDGYRFRGRGYVQLTGRRNYAKGSKVTGVDLLANPDKALDMAVAAKVAISGMTAGWFTGKKMADCKTFREMRRVINGLDRAGLIAGYAEAFLTALPVGPVKAPEMAPAAPPVVTVPTTPTPTPSPVVANPQPPLPPKDTDVAPAQGYGFWAWLFGKRT